MVNILKKSLGVERMRHAYIIAVQMGITPIGNDSIKATCTLELGNPTFTSVASRSGSEQRHTCK